MSNPARILHQTFSTWLANDPSGSSLGSRGYSGSAPEFVSRQLVHAAGLVGEVDVLLTQMEAEGRDVSTYRRSYPNWVYAVFSYPLGWRDSNQYQLFEPHWMDVLILLADAIDAMFQKPANDVQQLRDLIATAASLLEQDDSLTDQLRYYLHNLIQEIQHALADETVLDSFNLRVSLERLWVAFYGAAGQSRKPDVWTDLATKLWWPTASGVLVALPGLTIQALQLTQGGN